MDPDFCDKEEEEEEQEQEELPILVLEQKLSLVGLLGWTLICNEHANCVLISLVAD